MRMIDLPSCKLSRQDIYNRTDTKIEKITADLISDQTHTSVAFVDINKCSKAQQSSPLVCFMHSPGAALEC